MQSIDMNENTTQTITLSPIPQPASISNSSINTLTLLYINFLITLGCLCLVVFYNWIDGIYQTDGERVNMALLACAIFTNIITFLRINNDLDAIIIFEHTHNNDNIIMK